MIPVILAIALFMEQMDSTVIATALPSIASDLGTSPIALKLALTAYLVALAIFIPVSGWMADRYGAKRVFMSAIAVFVASSVLCSQANSLGFFVVARFLQGMGGAMMTPVARLVLVRGTPRSKLVSAMAWLTIPALAGPLLGPPVGGFITTFASWHWIFLINVPIGLIGLAATWRFLPQLPSFRPRPMDWKGFLLVAGCASGIIFGMSVISLPALPVWIGAVAVAAGFACGFLYVGHARRAVRPILSLSLLDNPTFRASVAGGSFFRIGVGAVPFLLPLMLQLGYGLTPFQSGTITFVSAVGAMSMKFAATTIFARYGFRPVLVAAGLGAAVTVAATAAVSPIAGAAWGLYLVLLAGGFSRSLFFTGVNALAFAEVSDEDASQATAFSAVAQQTSIAMGVAVAGGILESALYFRGGELGVAEFQIAFALVAIIMALGVIPFMRIDRNAGEEASGRLARSRREEIQNPAQ
jgi:EmrB/QacA subfamily drug resistance transporter